MFILVIFSPSNPSMPPLSLFTGFPSTGKLYWIQWGSPKKAISATLCEFPIFTFTYQYVILAHFLTLLFLVLGLFFFYFFFFFKRYSLLEFQPLINITLMTFLYSLPHFISVAVEIFIWRISLHFSAICGWCQTPVISGHVLTQSTKVCFKLLFPEAVEKRVA